MLRDNESEMIQTYKKDPSLNKLTFVGKYFTTMHNDVKFDRTVVFKMNTSRDTTLHGFTTGEYS